MDATDTTVDNQQPQAPASTAGNWMQAAGQVASGQQGDEAQQALTKMQHPNPDTQPQPQTPTTNQGVSGGVPLVLRPKQTGLAGIMGKIADVLAGTTRPEIFTDQDGNEFVYHPNLSRGEQWARIGAHIFQGAAAGMAGGKGAGNKGKAAMAGVEEGQQSQKQLHDQEEELDAKAQRDMLNRANATMLRMNMAEQAWRASRLQIQANQQDAEFSQKTIQYLHSMGGEVIGMAAHPGDLAETLKIAPELAKDFVQRHIIEPVATIDDQGHKGVTFVKMPNGNWRNQIVPPGAQVHFWNPATNQMEVRNASDGMNAGEQFDLDSKAFGDQLKWQNDTQEQKLKAAQIKNQESEAAARGQELPSKIAKNQAETREADARAESLKAGATNPDGTPNPTFEAMAQALYEGDILPRDLKRQAKGAGLDPNALMGRAVMIGKEHGQPWSESIIEQEQAFAKNEKTQAALDGIDRVIDPNTGYMAKMLRLAKQANLGTNGLYNSAELGVRRWFGESTAKTFETGVGELQRSVSGLIGNPLLGGGETDKKLESARELIGKSPTMKNLQAAADLINSALATQKQSIIGNNRFLRKRYAPTPAQAAAAQRTGQPQQPGGGQPLVISSDGKWQWDQGQTKWVPRTPPGQ